MTFSLMVAYFSLPLMGLGAGCFIISRRRKLRGLPPSNLIGLLAVLLIFVPFFLVFAFAHATEANLLAEDLILLPSGGALLLLMRFLKTPSAARALGIVGIALVALAAYNITGDFLRARLVVKGTVTHKYISHGYRGSPRYHVVINGRSFDTTLDLYNRIDTRSQVKAEIGQASGTIFEATEL